MILRKGIIIILIFAFNHCLAQQINALNLSVIIANNVRFKPYNNTQIETLANIDKVILINDLKTDEQKKSFWLNIYNSFMLLNLRDTVNEGDYTRFYKIKNIEIAQRKFSLYNIEHEFLRCGIRNKSLGFKKSELNKKDSLWKKLRPEKPDFRVLFCMYRGLYGYPPFQIVENANITESFNSYVSQHIQNFSKNNSLVVFDWIKKYKNDYKNNPLEVVFSGFEIYYQKTPKACYIENFFPKYEKVKFKEEDSNPWVK